MKEVAEDDLIPGDPGIIGRIGNRFFFVLGTVIFVFAVGRDDQHLRWSFVGAIKEPNKTSSTDRRQLLGVPHRVVYAGQLVRRRCTQVDHLGGR